MAQYMYDKDGNRTVILSEEEEQEKQRKAEDMQLSIGCFFLILITIGGLWSSHEDDKKENALWCRKMGVNDSEACEVLVKARDLCKAKIIYGDQEKVLDPAKVYYKVKPKYHKYFGERIICSKVFNK